MKKTTLISIAVLLFSSLCLTGCGKTITEEYAELCKEYEPYRAYKISGRFYNGIDKKIYNTEEEHPIMDKRKEYILEGEKIFVKIEALASKDTELMKDFHRKFIIGKNTPQNAKNLFNLRLEQHKELHKGCTYDFKF